MGFSRIDGVESVTLSIQKRIGADIIPLAEGVQRVLEEARKKVPQGVKFTVTRDRSEDVRMMVKDLENNILSGLVLVVLVLVLFMGRAPSMIVAMAIPMSMLISFAIIQMIGLTLNMIVLFSLIMALGMLVDNAIVIVENIYRHLELGYGRIAAAMKGTSEVAWPIITSTATTIAAFAPLLFWPGIMGDFMKYMPLTLIITLSSSLFVAMVISPTICSLMAKTKKKHKAEGFFVKGYRRLLNLVIHHRTVTLSLAILLLIGTVTLYGKFKTGVELFPGRDPSNGVINIRSPQGTNIYQSNALAYQVERRVEKFRGDIKHLVTTVGSSGGRSMIFGGSAGGPHMANLVLTFHDFEKRQRPSVMVLEDIRRSLIGFSGAEIKIEKARHGPPTGSPVTVRVIGEDFKILQRLSEKIRRMIADVPGIINLRSDFETARPELAFRINRRRALLLGIDTATVGNFLKTAIFGRKVGIYRQFKDEYDITIRLPEYQRVSIDDLLRLRVPNQAGKPIPLSSLGKFTYTGGYGTIRHVGDDRVVTIKADNAEGTLSTKVLAAVQEKLKQLNMPDGYRIQYAGEKEQQDEAKAFLSKAFVIALLLIVMILVAQFNTLSIPLIIMTTVMLSMIGVATGLMIFQMPFGIIMTGVGVISLSGVVVNNAIVLLAYTRQLQRQGMELIAAVIQAGATRLRPVLLTATTTILGLIPMATGISFDFHIMEFAWKSESSQWWASMAIVVIFGLAFATILTLLVVPALYVSLYRGAQWFGLAGDLRDDSGGMIPAPQRR